VQDRKPSRRLKREAVACYCADVFLVLLTLFLLNGGIVPYQSLHSTGTPFRDIIAGTLKIAWWLWAAWFLVGLSRSVVVFERRPREAKLVQE
jgi:hypothetical protein